MMLILKNSTPPNFITETKGLTLHHNISINRKKDHCKYIKKEIELHLGYILFLIPRVHSLLDEFHSHPPKLLKGWFFLSKPYLVLKVI